jgi:hypothetical protein
MRNFAALIFLLATTAAQAGRFDTINYECQHLKPNDGVRCVVTEEKGEQAMMLIRYTTSHYEDKERAKRATYVARKLWESYADHGGRVSGWRSMAKDGKMMERTCSSTGRGRICDDWEPATVETDKYWNQRLK